MGPSVDYLPRNKAGEGGRMVKGRCLQRRKEDLAEGGTLTGYPRKETEAK